MNRSRSLAVVLFGMTVFGLAAPWLLTRADPPRPAAQPPMPPGAGRTTDGFGYTAAFDATVARIGEITPDEFARRFPGKAQYLEKFSWDPTSAKFWDKFNLDPNAAGAEVRGRGPMGKFWAQQRQQQAAQQGKPISEAQAIMIPARGMYDFRLNKDELAHFKRNGFVVSERMGAKSTTDMFYRIYQRDLPVIITSDAILHGWHRSYDAMLEEIEVSYLSPTLAGLLAEMSAKITEARRNYGDGVLFASLSDADYFLAVARSLLQGSPVKSVLGQDDRVARSLRACADQQIEKIILFGRERKVDFSQFKPRGHYEKNEALKRYFRAMMWCGRIDLRVAGKPELASPRELGAAVVLNDLLRASGQFDHWRRFDQMLQTFVGKADSMTFAEIDGLLTAAKIRSPADLGTIDALAALQKKILDGKLGLQHIRGHIYESPPEEPGRLELPRTFTFLGQRFVVDSWVTAKVVYDEIAWSTAPDKKVRRRIPSALDVAFAAFGNDHVVPDLVARIKDPAGKKFRDGLNYQHNLAAVREVIDARDPKTWGENLYTGWLACLRELSTPTTDAKYPEAMRTRAWAMKTLNTQLASWTQLRHDTILYAKQSYTAEVSCFYPAGYVEPVPHFWARLEQLALRGANQIEQTPYPNNEHLRKHHAGFLRQFAKTVATLKGIAEKELAQKELSKEETKFLEDVVEVDRGCGGPRRYSGWYPALFYSLGERTPEKWDALVADVHTDTVDTQIGDPGCVLHQGVGNIDLLVIAIDNGKDRVVYAGPLLSHYEFETPLGVRKTDSEWRSMLNAGRQPPRPAWTRGYLVPGVNPEANNYSVEDRPSGGKKAE
jgi:hypothetical protein